MWPCLCSEFPINLSHVTWGLLMFEWAICLSLSAQWASNYISPASNTALPWARKFDLPVNLNLARENNHSMTLIKLSLLCTLGPELWHVTMCCTVQLYMLCLFIARNLNAMCDNCNFMLESFCCYWCLWNINRMQHVLHILQFNSILKLHRLHLIKILSIY